MNPFEVFETKRLENNHFMKHNHIEMISVQEGQSVFQLTMDNNSKNPYGYLHGGAIHTLADDAAAAAACSDGRYYVTQASSLYFLHSQTSGTVFASARVRHRGMSICLTTVDITSETGTLLATGEFSFFVIKNSEPTT